MRAAGRYLRLGHAGSCELPMHNEIWNRFGTKRVLSAACLNWFARVHLCATGLVSKSGWPVGKQLCFARSHESCAKKLHEKFGTCACTLRASWGDVNYTATGSYNEALARGIVKEAASTA